MEGEDGSGAVYIYHGSSKGIKLRYSQVCERLAEKTSTIFFIQSEISIADARSFSRAWYELRLVSLCLVARVPYWLLTFFFFFSENCGVVN